MGTSLEESSTSKVLSPVERQAVQEYLDAWLKRRSLQLVALFGALSALGVFVVFQSVLGTVKSQVENQATEIIRAELERNGRLSSFIEGLINSNREMIQASTRQLIQIDAETKSLVERSRTLQESIQANATRSAGIQTEMEQQSNRVANLNDRSEFLRRMVDNASQEAARLGRLGQQAERIEAVLRTYESMLDAIRNSPELRQELSASFAFPTGAVVSFSTRCPAGWLDFRDASGRVIVGAGEGILGDRRLTPREVRENGGTETVTLSRANLPSVSYPLPLNQMMQAVGTDRSDRYAVMHDGVSARADHGSIGPLGEGVPFQIMPPFLVLNYCIKR